MIDIHTHILPAVDDGSKSFEDSLKMIQLEIENGVDTIVLTPHYFKSELNAQNKDLIFSQYEKLLEKTKDFNIKLILGSEIYYSDEIMDELISNKIITLGNSKYLLIEFSLYDEYYNIPDVFLDIMALGYKVIFAHPERYVYLSVNQIKKISELGCLIQINTSSILGDFGRKIQKKAFKLIKSKCVNFIASDAHSLNVRKPNLKEALQFVEKKVKVKIENKIDL